MHVHFICRGNSFRSIIAEAYAKSLGLKDMIFTSSGTIARRRGTSNDNKHPIIVEQLERIGLGPYINKIGEKEPHKYYSIITMYVMYEQHC